MEVRSSSSDRDLSRTFSVKCTDFELIGLEGEIIHQIIDKVSTAMANYWIESNQEKVKRVIESSPSELLDKVIEKLVPELKKKISMSIKEDNPDGSRFKQNR